MTKAGFVNVTYATFKWPIGTWPKDPKLKQIGAYNRLGWEEGIEGWAMYLFTNHLGVCFAPFDAWTPNLAHSVTRLTEEIVAERRDSGSIGRYSQRFKKSCYSWIPDNVSLLSFLNLESREWLGPSNTHAHFCKRSSVANDIERSICYGQKAFQDAT